MPQSRIRNFSAAVLLSLSGTAVMAEDVVIGVPNWPSVQAVASILKLTIENRLELKVTLQEGSNVSVFKGMDAGSVDIHPEAWLPNLTHLKREFVDGKKSVKMSPLGATGTQAMCVTKGTAERTGIKSIKDLSKPEMAAKFDRNGDGKGDIWIGAKGWGSTPIEQVRARSYGYDKTVDLLIQDEAAALSEVDAAIGQKQNIAFFCYTPHHMFALHDLVVLEEPAHNPSKWLIVPPSPTPGWLERSTAGVAWDEATLHVSYATRLETEHPSVAAMLEKVNLGTEQLSEMTFALAVEGQDPATFAAAWVEENASVIDTWFE